MANYHSIWRIFNGFLIKLDKRPDSWEDRLTLFGAYLVNKGLQSSTLKSYFSAIKCVLREDGYIVNNEKLLLGTLTRACKLVNDQVTTRLPIQGKLLELILFEVERAMQQQPYLESLYKAIFCLGYYGLFRVGELATGSHPIKAANVHIGENKDKMLFILYSSKTHGAESRPQKVKITSNRISQDKNKITRFFCPFSIVRQYLALRGSSYINENEPFFIFRDRRPVTPSQIRIILKHSLSSLNLNPNLYGFHSLRIGRATDMVLRFNYSVQAAKFAGRWRSSIVYKYIRSND